MMICKQDEDIEMDDLLALEESPTPEERTLKLIETWLAEDTDLDDENQRWVEIKEAIEADRLSYRRRFRDE